MSQNFGITATFISLYLKYFTQSCTILWETMNIAKFHISLIKNGLHICLCFCCRLVQNRFRRFASQITNQMFMSSIAAHRTNNKNDINFIFHSFCNDWNVNLDLLKQYIEGFNLKAKIDDEYKWNKAQFTIHNSQFNETYSFNDSFHIFIEWQRLRVGIADCSICERIW